MRFYLPLMAILAALCTADSAQAEITLEYWYGVQDFSSYTSPAPGQFNPSTLQGLRDWTFTGQTKINSLTVNPGSQHILKIVLRDHDNVGNGSGYSFSGDGTFTNNLGIKTFAMRFTSVPGILSGTRDAVALDGQAQPVTVWSGANTTPTATNENINFAILNFGASYYTIGQLYFNAINMNGVFPFQQIDGDVLYPLANLTVTAGAPGSGNLTLSKPNTPAPTFGTIDDFGNEINYDSLLWGPSGTIAYSLPFFVVPEPSSMILFGLTIPVFGWRRMRSMLHCQKRTT